MALIVEFISRTPGQSSALEAVPNMQLRQEYIYLDCSDRLHWVCWARGDDFRGFQEALEDDSAIDRWSLLTDRGDSRLYELVIGVDPIDLVYPDMVDQGVHMLDRERSHGQVWTQLRCPSRASYRSIRERWEDVYGHCRTHRIVDEAEHDGSEDVLTPKQREVLTLALEEGYFDLPRQSELGDLTDGLDISESAVSQRIRRGLRELVRRECGDGPTNREPEA